MLIDEIDKMGADFRGDPASAMLEVLDPEQNKTFRDHYLRPPLRLSKVLFICTANQLETIRAPARPDGCDLALGLHGRREVRDRTQVPSAEQVEAHGLDPAQVSITDNALRLVAREYTREAGVRTSSAGLRISAQGRPRGRRGQEDQDPDRREAVRKWLGPRRFSGEVRKRTSDPGVATGSPSRRSAATSSSSRRRRIPARAG